MITARNMKQPMILMGYLIMSGLFLSGCASPQDRIEMANKEFLKAPSVNSLKEVVKIKSDSSTRYRHVALVARYMVEYPSLFKELAQKTKIQYTIVNDVHRLKEAAFQYYPELEPQNFVLRYNELYDKE